MQSRPRCLWLSLAVLPLLSGCQIGVLAPQGPVGEAQRLILLNSVAIMLCIVIPVIVMTFAFGWWFRASNTKARYLPYWAYSGRLEFVVWSIPALVVLFLGGITWIGSHDLDPYKPLDVGKEPLEVQVVSLDWKWLFIYPTLNFATVNELVIPAGQPVHFKLTSATVMSAFFVPQLGSMIYTMNGMETQLHLMANKPGDLYGMSSHYNGDGFSDMDFKVRSLDRANFDAFIGKVKSGDQALDTATYGQLVQESKNVEPFTYKSVEQGLFDAIIRRTAPEAPGPQIGEPSVDVSPRSKS